jgi:putative transposase
MAGTYAKLYYHIIFSTKHRASQITADFEHELHQYIGGIVRNLDGACWEINGMLDHLHLLALLPPKAAISDALRVIKANSSKWVREEQPTGQAFCWQDGYAAFSVSKSLVDPVSKYIRDQKRHHQKSDFKQELLGWLAKNEVEFDERYLWD